MDFELDEHQQDLTRMVDQMLAKAASAERLREIERSAADLDLTLWGAMCESGLPGIAVPEDFGGAGLGIMELAMILERQGAHVAPAPLWSWSVAAAALARFGTPQQCSVWLPAATSGEAPVGLAAESGAGAAVQAAAVDGDLRLTGEARNVPGVPLASRLLVVARTCDGPALVLVDPAGARVSSQRAQTLDGTFVHHVSFTDAPAEPVGEEPVAAARWVLNASRVALAALQLGVMEGATRLVAAHLSQREQFGRPLATFQSIAHLLAECYIDSEALRVLVARSAWQADQGADFTACSLMARWWAEDAGERTAYRVQHLFGGIGLDVDHPGHRYFLWGTQLANTLGCAEQTLADLGELLATG